MRLIIVKARQLPASHNSGFLPWKHVVRISCCNLLAYAGVTCSLISGLCRFFRFLRDCLTRLCNRRKILGDDVSISIISRLFFRLILCHNNRSMSLLTSVMFASQSSMKILQQPSILNSFCHTLDSKALSLVGLSAPFSHCQQISKKLFCVNVAQNSGSDYVSFQCHRHPSAVCPPKPTDQITIPLIVPCRATINKRIISRPAGRHGQVEWQFP